MPRQTPAWVIALLFGSMPLGRAVAQTPDQVRQLIIDRVGSLEALMVPPADEFMPQPDDEAFRITPEKKRLGKLLFFDPVRSNRVDPDMGSATHLAQTASCGSCHLGEAGSKAGQQQAIAIGGQGRGRFDAVTGRFHGTREIMPGLTDVLPTPLQRFDGVGNLMSSGALDAVDAPARLSPTLVGFASNRRLFWSGPAGEPYDPNNNAKANLNPRDLPAAENAVEFTFFAHRMIGTQQYALRAIPVYVELFRRAFPEEAAAADQSRNLDDLINDRTIARAIATFLRTVVTRNSPWDRFLAGDDSALTAAQLRGAALYFTPADQGGANCVACHSGFALNKVLGDEDGQLVHENFHNIGIGDHPLMQLARDTIGDDSIRDIGRLEATGSLDDLFKFKTPSLRQQRDAGAYTHSGEFESIREFVRYFRDGVPRSEDAAAAGNLSPLFSAGLDISADDIDALVDFIENGLHDPDFVTLRPDSTTDTFDLNERDLTYDLDLMFMGAQNGWVPSGLQHPQTDEQTREDMLTTNPPASSCGGFGPFGLFATAAPLALRRRRTRAPADRRCNAG